MQGVLRELVKQGLLLDANGNKVLDLSGKHQQALTDLQAKMKSFNDQIAGLEASIAGEAPEEFMGVVERQTRAQIDALQAQAKAAEDEYNRLAAEAQDSADEWGHIHQQAAQGFYDFAADLFGRGLEFPVRFVSDGPVVPGLPVPAVPAMGDGGIVRRPTIALIGEGGPEAVIPLDRLRDERDGPPPMVGLQDIVIKIGNDEVGRVAVDGWFKAMHDNRDQALSQFYRLVQTTPTISRGAGRRRSMVGQE
jgi:hypothetical protein